MDATQTPIPTPPARTTEELRAEMCRILDELATARADRASALKARFDALWSQVPAGEETRH